MKLIYIAGKISGECETPELLAKCCNKFDRYGLELLCDKVSYTHGILINSDYIGKPGQEWKDYMKRDLAVLLTCNEIHMLPDWEDSKGATIEHDLAQKLGIKIVYAK